MKITIAGYGFVGKAHASVLKPYHEIIIVDPKISSAKIYSEPTDAVIVCVSTPKHDSGACNIDHVYEVISNTDPTTPVLIKSTISLEGWLHLKESFPNHSLTFSPEFLRAETAEKDFKNTKYLHYGGDGIVFWEKIFREVFPDVISVHSACAEELILTKYFRNAFLATKVSFFNQVYDMCQAFGIDYKRVAFGIGTDPRIGTSHTEVTAARGWGGHCFPKDAAAILHTAELEGIDLSIIREAVEYNKSIRK
jgi:UDPglucose 6-dehydrogenase